MGTDNSVVLNDNWILHNGKLRDLMAVRSVGKIFFQECFLGNVPMLIPSFHPSGKVWHMQFLLNSTRFCVIFLDLDAEKLRKIWQSWD